MAPPTKSKKIKRESSNSKNFVRLTAAPADPKAVDSDWWDSFLHRNSSPSGSTIPSDEAEAFKHFFRVSEKTFYYICSLVRPDLVSRPPSGLINIEGRLLSVEKQVAIALRRLASGESQVSVGLAFGVGQSTVSQVTWRFVEALEARGRRHLKWPSPDRMEEIKSRFEALSGLPNCCGAIDATHIVMTLPVVQSSDDWCDQERNYSMLLQGIMDHDMRFLDVVTGWPGAMSVSRLLKCSGFYKLAQAGDHLNGMARILGVGEEVGEYIVGGVGYPLLPWLITAYHGGSPDVLNFDRRHEAARVVAAQALSRLKGTWRILNKVMWRPDRRKLPSIVLVCCLLHNIIIDSGDGLRPDVALPGCHDVGYVEPRCSQVDALGWAAREKLSQYLIQGGTKTE